jgi:DNA-binding transcriptional MerR regulator
MSETAIIIQAEPLRMRRKDAAAFLGISPRQLQYLVSAGVVPFVLDKENGERMFSTADLRAYVDNQKRRRGSAA